RPTALRVPVPPAPPPARGRRLHSHRHLAPSACWSRLLVPDLSTLTSQSSFVKSREQFDGAMNGVPVHSAHKGSHNRVVLPISRGHARTRSCAKKIGFVDAATGEVREAVISSPACWAPGTTPARKSAVRLWIGTPVRIQLGISVRSKDPSWRAASK